jgi:hypothetical protein
MRLWWIAVIVASKAEAGPWSKSLGQAYVKVGEGFFLSNQYVDSTGAVHDGVDYFGASTYAYFEVGLYDGLQVQGFLPYTVGINTFQDDWKYMRTGGGDAVVGAQWSPPFPFPAAVRLELKVPMYDVARFNSFEALSTKFPCLGEGQLDVTPWISIGGGIPGTDLYVFGEVGYRFRTEAYVGRGYAVPIPYADTFVSRAQAGYKLFERLTIMATGEWLMPVVKDIYTKGYLVTSIGTYLRVYGGLAVEASFDPIVWATNASRGYGFGAGLSYAF